MREETWWRKMAWEDQSLRWRDRDGFKGGGRDPWPQASHQRGASHQILHIFSFVICVILGFYSLPLSDPK